MKEFAPYIQEEVMQAAFQQYLPGFASGKHVITHCQRLNTVLKTYLKAASQRKACLSTVWRLATEQPRSQQLLTQILYAKNYLDGRSRKVFAQADRTRLVPVQVGAALTHVAALDMVVWTFPNDPVMHNLAEAVEPQRVIHHLRDVVVPDGEQDTQQVSEVQVEVVNYRPEIRSTAWYRLQENATTGPRTRTLFGKTYADTRGRDIYQRQQQLWQLSEHNRDDFLTARPAGYSERIDTFWLEELPGIPLSRVLHPTNYRKYLEDAARCLAFFQHSGLAAPERLTLAAQLEEVRKKAAKLTLIFPETASAVGAIVHHLEQNIASLSPAPHALVHGDFHLRQLLVHQGRIALFDFDEIGYGDPIEDLAYFLADLYASGYDHAAVQMMAATLLTAWSNYTGWPVALDRLQWHVQEQLLTKAWRAVLQQQSDLTLRVQRYIALATSSASRICMER